MSKKIAIIESDSGFSQKLRSEFEGKGFSVVDTPDGKSAVELVKREKPDLVVLSQRLTQPGRISSELSSDSDHRIEAGHERRSSRCPPRHS